MEIGVSQGERHRFLVVAAACCLVLCCSRAADDPDRLLNDVQALGEEWQTLSGLAATATTAGDLDRICGRVNVWLRRFDRTDRAVRDYVQDRDDLPTALRDRQRDASLQMRAAAVAVQQACER